MGLAHHSLTFCVFGILKDGGGNGTSSEKDRRGRAAAHLIRKHGETSPPPERELRRTAPGLFSAHLVYVRASTVGVREDVFYNHVHLIRGFK